MAVSHAGLERFVARIESHTCLASVEREALLNLSCHALNLRTNRDFARAGDAVAYATLVLEGWVGRYESMQSGAREITAIYLPGDFVDLHSVLMPVPRSGLTSLSGATILRVPHSELLELVHRFPNIGLAFWKDLALDASILAKWIANIGRKDARTRIAHLLCELGLRCERAGLGRRDHFAFPLKQEQVGDATGLTAIHVNRMMRAFAQEGIAFVSEQQMIVKWDELVYVADFAPLYLERLTVDASDARRLAI